MSRSALAVQDRAVAPCICRKRNCAECSQKGLRTCAVCLRVFMYRAGQPFPTTRCSADCAPHNETMDVLEKRLEEATERFEEAMRRNAHLGAVMQQEEDEWLETFPLPEE